ncbi:ArsR/SmtB family transcription factor [Phycicoccus sonneratiae]|uniref:Helix-turn-helix transcriptional regulator n=1 Tax=Phycicoccus sonneratiae TaxID=2807628 RepID=A0ABS2CPN3_9MICO|nr:helix-turn-helix transcriptional regulator [Phycicoccus sonneraticus]MBM6401841.1 helix-turn-helix transcriptional regulator [Phycicoccus sonneraticus]
MSTSAPPVGPADAAVFAALGDATRLTLLATLGTTGASTATRLAAPLPVTRQAVSRHLRVLEDAGLVRTSKQGRDVLYAVDVEAVAARADWLASVSRAWDRRLDDLRTRAERR